MVTAKDSTPKVAATQIFRTIFAQHSQSSENTGNSRFRSAASTDVCVLHPPIRPLLAAPIRAAILRGGKYVFFGDAQTIACWRVSDDSLLGTYRTSVPSPNICAFAAEALDDVERANIVICIRSSVAANP